MVRIRRFSVIKTANVVALIYAIAVSIILVPILLLLSVASVGTFRGTFVGGAGVGAALVGGLIAVIVYTILGWIFTAIACLIYNLAAKWAGGIEVEVERFERMPPVGPASWGQPQYGQPQYGQPQYGQPQWQQPGTPQWQEPGPPQWQQPGQGSQPSPGTPSGPSSWPPPGPTNPRDLG